METGETRDIYIGVSQRPEDSPELPNGHTSTSPVVLCGPQGTTFMKPVLLAFPHCIPSVHNAAAKIMWYTKQQQQWTKADENTAIFSQNRCILLIHHFCGYSLSCDCKRIQASAFGEYYQDDDTSIEELHARIYCVDDTTDETSVCTYIYENVLEKQAQRFFLNC